MQCDVLPFDSPQPKNRHDMTRKRREMRRKRRENDAKRRDAPPLKYAGLIINEDIDKKT